MHAFFDRRGEEGQVIFAPSLHGSIGFIQKMPKFFWFFFFKKLNDLSCKTILSV